MESIETSNKMTVNIFGNGIYKKLSSTYILDNNSIILDVTSNKELSSIAFSLVHHIPINGICEGLKELSHCKVIGAFCSSRIR